MIDQVWFHYWRSDAFLKVRSRPEDWTTSLAASALPAHFLSSRGLSASSSVPHSVITTSLSFSSVFTPSDPFYLFKFAEDDSRRRSLTVTILSTQQYWRLPHGQRCSLWVFSRPNRDLRPSMSFIDTIGLESVVIMQTWHWYHYSTRAERIYGHIFSLSRNTASQPKPGLHTFNPVSANIVSSALPLLTRLTFSWFDLVLYFIYYYFFSNQGWCRPLFWPSARLGTL